MVDVCVCKAQCGSYSTNESDNVIMKSVFTHIQPYYLRMCRKWNLTKSIFSIMKHIFILPHLSCTFSPSLTLFRFLSLSLSLAFLSFISPVSILPVSFLSPCSYRVFSSPHKMNNDRLYADITECPLFCRLLVFIIISLWRTLETNIATETEEDEKKWRKGDWKEREEAGKRVIERHRESDWMFVLL